IAEGTTVTISQGVLFGFPPSFTVILDGDTDGINDDVDNCPSIANANQQDTDNDGTGDVCDETPNGDTDPNDLDGDGTVNDEDPSPEGGFACKLFDDGRFVCG
ncbi:MAG TPA: hypothetical protein DHT34_01085, partial [Cellvibrionales bacterium]|nr:hypothetical protein [Cellvibrionales bacterium]